MGAGLGIGQGVVMGLQVESAGRSDGMELMVGQPRPEMTARRAAGAIKPVARPWHVVEVERRPQTPLVERRIVRHQGQPPDAGRHFAPYLLELGRLVGIGAAQTVDRRSERAVVIRTRADEAVERIDLPAAAHDDHAYRTDARPVAVGRLEVDRCEVGHHSHSIVAGGLDEMS